MISAQGEKWSHASSLTYGFKSFGKFRNGWFSTSNNEGHFYNTGYIQNIILKLHIFPHKHRRRVYPWSETATKETLQFIRLYFVLGFFCSLFALCISVSGFRSTDLWARYGAVKYNRVNSFIFHWQLQGRLFRLNVCVTSSSTIKSIKINGCLEKKWQPKIFFKNI